MFGTLFAHLKEALHKRQFVNSVHVMSVGCTSVEVELGLFINKLNKKCITLV
jgi:hypothetical protein